MSNERIDLTQFDWMEDHSIKYMENTGGLALVDVNAIEMIPELIAELKRCYEKIDSLQGKIDKANYAMQRYCDEWPDLPWPDHPIDNVCDAYDEVCSALD